MTRDELALALGDALSRDEYTGMQMALRVVDAYVAAQTAELRRERDALLKKKRSVQEFLHLYKGRMGVVRVSGDLVVRGRITPGPGDLVVLVDHVSGEMNRVHWSNVYVVPEETHPLAPSSRPEEKP